MSKGRAVVGFKHKRAIRALIGLARQHPDEVKAAATRLVGCLDERKERLHLRKAEDMFGAHELLELARLIALGEEDFPPPVSRDSLQAAKREVWMRQLREEVEAFRKYEAADHDLSHVSATDARITLDMQARHPDRDPSDHQLRKECEADRAWSDRSLAATAAVAVGTELVDRMKQAHGPKPCAYWWEACVLILAAEWPDIEPAIIEPLGLSVWGSRKTKTLEDPSCIVLVFGLHAGRAAAYKEFVKECRLELGGEEPLLVTKSVPVAESPPSQPAAEVLASLRAPAQVAWMQYEGLLRGHSELKGATDKELYARLTASLDEEPCSFETWARHLREARRAKGLNKRQPRQGRTGRSIVQATDL